ncbi:hypothetical protein V5O48_013881 [Marasmius crinis-equi]|uniref:VHS domain-containing protein n=1 Tax=Marasmius crinis-equi TaxID=585013 RepID=A0ABR3EYV3_9AGAR
MDTPKPIIPAPEWKESIFTQVWGNVDYPGPVVTNPSPQIASDPFHVSSTPEVSLDFQFSHETQERYLPSTDPRNERNPFHTPSTSETNLVTPDGALRIHSDYGTISVDPRAEPAVDAFATEVLPMSIFGSSPLASATTSSQLNSVGASVLPVRTKSTSEITSLPRATRNPLSIPFDALRSRFSSNWSAPHSSLVRDPIEAVSGASTSTTTGRRAQRTRKIDYREGVITSTIGCEDWALILDVCERASANENNAKEAARALRKTFKYEPPPAQLGAVRLWVTMLRNCSELFISQATTKRFFDVLEDLLSTSRTNLVVKERVLNVLGTAAYASKNEKDAGFRMLWKRYKAPDKPEEGIPFDTDDPTLIPPWPSDSPFHDDSEVAPRDLVQAMPNGRFEGHL